VSETLNDEAAERKAARAGTVSQRRAYAGSRRERFAERDADRFRLAAEPGEVEIPQGQGYLQVPPPAFDDLTAPVLEHANGLIESIGHDALLEGGKGGFIGRGFLPDAMLELGSPYLRLALDERIVHPIAH